MINLFFNWLIALTVFSAPVTALMLPHGGTANYVVLILLGMVTGWGQIKKFTQFETLFFAGLLILFLVNIVSFTQTENISGGYSWMGKYLYLFLGLFAYAVIKDKYQFLAKYFDLFLVLNAALIGGVAAYQYYYLNIPRIYGYSHPILYADVSMALAGVILCRMFFSRTHWVLYPAFVACIIAAVLTQTRGALIALPVILVTLFFLTKAYQNKKLLLLTFIMAGLFVASITMKESPISYRFTSTADQMKNLFSSSAQIQTAPPFLRMEFWKNSYILWKTNPVLGIGPGDYNIEMKRLVDSGKSINTSDMNYNWTPHSNIVNSLVTSGITGLIAFLMATLLWPLILINKFKISNDHSSCFIVVLVSYFIFGITTTWLATHAGFSIFMILLLISMPQMSLNDSSYDNETLTGKV